LSSNASALFARAPVAENWPPFQGRFNIAYINATRGLLKMECLHNNHLFLQWIARKG